MPKKPHQNPKKKSLKTRRKCIPVFIISLSKFQHYINEKDNDRNETINNYEGTIGFHNIKLT